MQNNFEKISDYLKQRSILTLATTGKDNAPVLSTVDFMWTGQALFFLTDARSRKAQNLQNNASIVAIVTDQDSTFFETKSVEIFGQAKQTQDPEKIGAYMQNFMSRRTQFASAPPNPEMQANLRVYEIVPTKFRMLDNTVAIGHIEEISF